MDRCVENGLSCMTKAGFTLLELLVAMALFGFLATMLVPNLRSPGYERRQFIGKLNALTRFAWQNAIITDKIHKIQFDFTKEHVSVQIEQGRDSAGERIFGPLKQALIRTSFTIPTHIAIKNFFIEGFDEMSRFVGRKTAEAWFYIVPDGLAQEVVINFFDMKDIIAEKARPVGLVLNPFSAQFKEYGSFQK